MRISDWSSDVCSSDLHDAVAAYGGPLVHGPQAPGGSGRHAPRPARLYDALADRRRLDAAAGGAQENHDLVRAFGAPAADRGARPRVQGVARPCSAVGCEKRWQFRMNVEWRCPLRSWLLAGAVALASCAPEQAIGRAHV